VHLKMKDVYEIIVNKNGDSIVNTGSPHYIKNVAAVNAINVFVDGREIRYNNDYKTEGINVNFVEDLGDKIIVRTYERGVEDETLSCGTGVTAAALVHATGFGNNTINITTPGGDLAVAFNKTAENKFDNIWLCGPASLVFSGTIEI